MSRIQEEIPGIKRGRLTKNLIAESVPEIFSRRIHLCGSPPMMESMKTILAELEVPKKNLKTESFGPRGVTKKIKTTVPTADTSVATVFFKKSGKSGSLSSDGTILEVAEELEVEIESACRSGVCGTCKVKLLSGAVKMECEDGLESEEKEQGFILACQAKSINDVEVDA
jgi:ferredoxin